VSQNSKLNQVCLVGISITTSRCEHRRQDICELPLCRYPLSGDHWVFFADRFRAAAAAALAFFARATRCAGVMVSSDRRPPMRPPFAPCSRK